MQVEPDFRYFASAISAVKSCARSSPYSPPQTAQTALAVQVAVPPEQLSVSVWLASREQTRVWVTLPLDVHAPYSWPRTLPDSKVASLAVPLELRPQTVQDL